MALPLETLDTLSLQNELDAIGGGRAAGKGA